MFYSHTKEISKEELRVTSLNTLGLMGIAASHDIAEQMIRERIIKSTHYSIEGGEKVEIRIEVVGIHPDDCAKMMDQMDKMVIETCEEFGCKDSQLLKLRNAIQNMLRKYLYTKRIPAKRFPFTTVSVQDLLDLVLDESKLFDVKKDMRIKLEDEGYLDKNGKITEKANNIGDTIGMVEEVVRVVRPYTDQSR